MTHLPPRVDWHGVERAASTERISRAEGIAARIRREAQEIRTAADHLAALGPVETATAGFLRVQAELLDRAGGTAERANTLRPEEDTRDISGMFPTPARSALLIARAHHQQRAGR
ncbi:hypothetical protein ACFRKD_26840 [Streptomyces niveus]|uniref:hypothetical protein n=1 Tax=Streptomyces niveus TaxID=193462 RepID=UPI0036AC534E